MKRSTYLLFAMIFLVSTSGLTLHAHYCHDELHEISLLKVPDNCCDNHCSDCKDESIVVKLESDSLPVFQNTTHINPSVLMGLPIKNVDAHLCTLQKLSKKTPLKKYPPGLSLNLASLQSFLC